MDMGRRIHSRHVRWRLAHNPSNQEVTMSALDPSTPEGWAALTEQEKDALIYQNYIDEMYPDEDEWDYIESFKKGE